MRKIFLSLIIATSYNFVLDASDNQARSESPEGIAGVKQERDLSWEEGTAQFREAFARGDIEKLNNLRDRIEGFGNLDDLGEGFLNYGNVFSDSWDEMIQDAEKNREAQ